MSSDYEIVKEFIFNDEVQRLLDEISNNTMAFNILEITGMGEHEIRHSNLLSWFFGDNEHGLRYKIFEGFLEKVIENNSDCEFIDELKYYLYLNDKERNLTIYREKNSIDILIVDESNKFVFTIENKLNAPERIDGKDGGQLKKYYEYINKNYRDKYKKYFIYLTIDNSYPSEGNEGWLLATHEMVGQTVEQILTKNNVNKQTNLLLSSYLDLLKRRNIMEDKKLEKICEQIWAKNTKALDILYNYRKTDLDRFYDIVLEDKRFDIYDDGSIMTNMHNLLSSCITGKKWEDSENYTIEIQFKKYKNYIWFGYWHPNAKEFIKSNDKYKEIYEKLFGKRITKEHKIFLIEESEFYDNDFDKLTEKYIQKMLNEIKRFENIVSEVLGK